MAFLGSLFSRAKNKQSDSIARATGSSVGASMGGFGIGQLSVWDIDRAVNDGLEKVTWIFRAVDVISMNQSSIPIHVTRGNDPIRSEKVKNDRINKLMNQRPNTYETAQQFRYRLSANLLLSRRGAFVEVLEGADGQPVELHLLPAGAVTPIPDPHKFVSGYRVNRGDYRGEDVLPPERVVWIKTKPHPTDPYMQLTPLMSAGIAANTNYLAHVFNQNFIANDGRPGLIVSVNGMINPQDAQDLKRRFSGIQRAGETTVIENATMDIKDTSGNPRDVQWQDMLNTTKDEILMAFGVPESVMGNAAGRTYDNADAERENFWLDTMKPHCQSIAASFDVLTGNVNDDIMLQYDFETIDVLQRVRRARTVEKAQEFASGVATLNDYLEFTGKTPIDSAKARAYIHPQGFFINALSDNEELDNVRLFTQPKEPDLSALFGAMGGSEEGGADGEEETEGAPPQIPAELQAMLSAGQAEEGKQLFDRARKRQSKRNKLPAGYQFKSLSAIDRYASGRESETEEDRLSGYPNIGERLNDEGSIEQAIQWWEVENAQILASDVPVTYVKAGFDPFDLEGRVLTLHGVIQRRIDRIVRRELSRAARDMRKRGLVVPDSLYADIDKTVADISAPVLSRLDEAVIAKYTRIRNDINDMRGKGESRSNILRVIRAGVGLRAPWRRQLSISLVTTAVESTKYTAYSKHGRLHKRWRSLTDGRTRHTHLRANGQRRLAKNKFRVGRSWMRFPGDPLAPIGETINCRCWMTYED